MELQALQSAALTTPSAALEKSPSPPSSTGTGPEKQKSAPRLDQYIPETGGPPPSAGIYRVIPSKDGEPRIEFDDPEPEKDQSPQSAIPKRDKPEEKEEKTTINTDKVDREIQKLKERQKALLQELETAPENRRQELERQLSQVEQELSQKDNDAYRRSHADVS